MNFFFVDRQHCGSSLSLFVSTLVLALSFAHTLCENADDFVLFFLSPLADGSMCFFSSPSSCFTSFKYIHIFFACCCLPLCHQPRKSSSLFVATQFSIDHFCSNHLIRIETQPKLCVSLLITINEVQRIEFIYFSPLSLSLCSTHLTEKTE